MRSEFYEDFPQLAARTTWTYSGTPEALAELLTMAGVEVEGVITRGGHLDKVVVAQILSREQHPNADRLSVCKVNDGSGQPPRQIVCGAKNFKEGDKVPLALPGAELPGDVKISVGKLRGVESEGMLCSAKELRLADDAEGLLILSPEAPVGMAVGELFPPDTIFDLEITPNRSDLLSHFGLAREVAALSGATLKNPLEAMETPPGGDPVAHLLVVVAANAREACPFYTARVIEDVQVGPSPEWLRSRLESVGVRSINNVVDVTNYVMMELGQPLHAFDATAVGLSGIGVRWASPGEELKALDGRTYKLSPHHLVIAQVSDEKAVGESVEGLAGVMGGEESGVTAATTRIILESAYFAPAGIRRTSRELGLSSEASYRFERGVDPEGVLDASRRAEDLLLQVCGGTSLGLVQTRAFHGHDGHDNEAAEPVPLRLSRVEQMLGEPITTARVDEILTGFGLERVGGTPDEDEDEEDETEWIVPSYRLDLRREIDLIEEIVRVHGLDRVESRIGGWVAPSSAVDKEYDFQISLKRRLAGMGFVEARSATLVRHDPSTGSLALVPSPLLPAGATLKNPLNEENSGLRGTLLLGLLAAAGRNVRQGVANLRLFEIGRVFDAKFSPGKPEPWLVSLVMTGSAQPHSWRHGNTTRVLDLYDLRAVLQDLVSTAKVEFRPVTSSFGPNASVGLVAEVLLNGQFAGGVAQLAPARVKELELRGDVFMAELRISTLASAKEFTPLPRFPSVTRDLAVVVDHTFYHGQIDDALRSAKEPLLSSVELFDVFTDDRGEKIAAGKKSLAYSLTFRAEDRTLRAEEVNAAHARLKGVLQAGFGGLQFRE